MNLCQYQQFDKQSDETLIIEREFVSLWEMHGHSNLLNISVTTPRSLE